MKKMIMILSFVTLVSSCGKSNDSVVSGQVTGNGTLTTNGTIDSFEGVYDLIRMDTEDCEGSIELIKKCEGLQLRHNRLETENFCNINKGELKTGDNRSSTKVTLLDNVLKSVVLIFDERSIPAGKVKSTFTNTLTLDSEGNLLKVSDLKNRKSRCLYQKR